MKYLPLDIKQPNASSLISGSDKCVFFQLAKYIYQDGKGVKMTNVKQLCTTISPKGCATWYPTDFPDCVSTTMSLKKCATWHPTDFPDCKFINAKQLCQTISVISLLACHFYCKISF